VLKIVGNLWAVEAPARTPLGELIALPQIHSWWGVGLLSPPKNPTPLSAFGLDFQPFDLGPQ